MNYFKSRLQYCKVGSDCSETIGIVTGVPQGSVLGPLLFLIYINDLSLSSELESCHFTDDTALFKSDFDFDSTLSQFKQGIEPLLCWIKYNQLTINWNKTKLMCVSKKEIHCCDSVVIDGNSVEIVNTFKLLGVHIDSCLNFNTHIKELKLTINKNLFLSEKLEVSFSFFKTSLL